MGGAQKRSKRVGLADWNWRLPAELQDVPWDCACASTSWALQTIGMAWTEAEVTYAMHPEYVNEAYGLLDASGAGLVQWLASVGVTAENNPNASWSDVVGAAGYQPMLIGGRHWCHWSGVRITNAAYPYRDKTWLALANPAPGWMDIHQLMNEQDFHYLGPFSAVWFVSW